MLQFCSRLCSGSACKAKSVETLSFIGVGQAFMSKFLSMSGQAISFYRNTAVPAKVINLRMVKPGRQPETEISQASQQMPGIAACKPLDRKQHGAPSQTLKCIDIVQIWCAM